MLDATRYGSKMEQKFGGKPLSTSRQSVGMALGLLGVTIFGGTLPATRVALGAFSPWFIVFGRAAMASIAAGLLLALLRKSFPRAHLGNLLLAGALLVFGFPIFSTIALQTVPASHGGVVLAILPLLTSIFATLIAGERPSPLFWVCGVVGAALVIGFALNENGMNLTGGDVWLFGAAVSASFGYVISGKVSRHMSGWEVICWCLVLTAPISLPAAYLSWHPAFLQASAVQASAFLYLSFGSMFLGFFAWNVGLAMGGMARVSQVQLIQAFVTIGLAALFLGEPITPATVIFAIAVVGVVMLGRRARVTVRTSHS